MKSKERRKTEKEKPFCSVLCLSKKLDEKMKKQEKAEKKGRQG